MCSRVGQQGGAGTGTPRTKCFSAYTGFSDMVFSKKKIVFLCGQVHNLIEISIVRLDLVVAGIILGISVIMGFIFGLI